MFFINDIGNDCLQSGFVSQPKALNRRIWAKFASFACLLTCQLWATGCSSQVDQSLAQANQSEILQAQRQHVRRQEVTVEAPVVRLLPDDTQGIPHERFLIRLANGSTVLVAHDTNMAPRVPLVVGDMVRIHGEYIWNEKGGVLHWTHHTDTPRHPGGWIEVNGKHYE